MKEYKCVDCYFYKSGYMSNSCDYFEQENFCMQEKCDAHTTDGHISPELEDKIFRETDGNFGKPLKEKQNEKKLRKVFIRLFCPHWYWHEESVFAMGSFSRGVIVCNNCGKRKFIEQLKNSEVLVDWQEEVIEEKK